MKKDFSSISPLLDNFLSRFQIKPHVQQAQLISAWQQIVPTVIKQPLATKAVSFKNQELLVLTENPVLAQEIHTHSTFLIKQLQHRFPHLVIKKIRTKIGTLNES